MINLLVFPHHVFRAISGHALGTYIPADDAAGFVEHTYLKLVGIIKKLAQLAIDPKDRFFFIFFNVKSSHKKQGRIAKIAVNT